MTIRCPGQDNTVLHKSEGARFETLARPRIPLFQFAARKTVISHHNKLISHQSDETALKRADGKAKGQALMNEGFPYKSEPSKFDKTRSDKSSHQSEIHLIIKKGKV